jgi:glycerol-3-phosphate acyltransferase PlsX
MVQPLIISIDVMGGDFGPAVTLAGAAMELKRRPDTRFELYGDEAVVKPVLDLHPDVKAAATFHHCEVTVAMDEKPSTALRHGRWKSSMWKSIEAVKEGRAHFAISAGNTGALMAMSKFCLHAMENIERPAIASIWPTLKAECIVLDCGATIGADAQQLVDFAVMGAAMARTLFLKDVASVGLLNIGVEDVKGNEDVRNAGLLLRETALGNLDYAGFVEGDDISKGNVDVIVTEGFTGNIALKTAEGTSKQLTTYLRSSLNRNWMTRLGYLLARSAFVALREKMDPRKHNGGVFLGLNGIVIKSHGGTDAMGFASALDLGYDMARNDLVHRIETDLAHYYQERLGKSSVDNQKGSRA